MKAIADVIEFMKNTLDEANDYYHAYLRYKEDMPKIATTSLEMARSHLSLYSKWHDVVTYLINEYKSSNKQPPQVMQEIWSFKHEKLVDEYDELKYKIDNAKY